MVSETKHVVFAGGGTAGHLFPGLAVAEQLASMSGWRSTFAGAREDFETPHVRSAGFDYFALPCRPVPTGPSSVLRFMVDHLAGYRAARRYLQRNKTAAVVGLGGYASVPMARAAVSLRIPLILLEQNAVPGRATRWLAGSADTICLTMPQAKAYFSQNARLRVTGNPLRRSFCKLFQNQNTGAPKKRCLVVLGGSGGAQTLNEVVPKVLYKLRLQLSDWRVVHQTGSRGLDVTRELYRKLGLKARVEAFLTEVPDLLSQASLAVCRAGGTTLAELAAAGVPAVLVPYPHATDDHQLRNAEVYAAVGAAKIVEQRGLDGRLLDVIAATLAPLVADRQLRQSMSAAALKLSRPDAAWHVATAITEVLDDRSYQRSAA